MEKNIDPQHIQGTGKGGRIQLSDLSQPAHTPPPLSTPTKASPQQPPPTPNDLHEETRREKMTTIRKRIAERLVASQHNTATLTTFNEVDMTRIIQLRKEYKEVFQKKIRN